MKNVEHLNCPWAVLFLSVYLVPSSSGRSNSERTIQEQIALAVLPEAIK